MEQAFSVAKRLIDGLGQVIRGKRETIDLVITALLADGHVLLEDYPGSGKTTLSKTLGGLISSDLEGQSDIASFRRVQFTPDLLPGDVLGVNIFEPKEGSFRFIKGPVFSHIVLADEINRTGPKVQAAFLECMAEKQVTIDNTTYPLDALFFVIGTQNPLDLAGTYPLPLVQLDRFLFRVPMSYVDKQTELEILTEHDQISDRISDLTPVVSRSDILAARSEVKQVEITPIVRESIVDIVQGTRDSKLVKIGASTRAALMLQNALRAYAVVQERSYVTEDDLKYVTPFVLGHRVQLHPSGESRQELIAALIEPHLERLIAQPIAS